LWLDGLRTRLVTMKMWVRSLASLNALRTWHCCELGCRSQTGLRFGLLWLWCRQTARAPIRLPYAIGVVLKKKKKRKKKEKKRKRLHFVQNIKMFSDTLENGIKFKVS